MSAIVRRRRRPMGKAPWTSGFSRVYLIETAGEYAWLLRTQIKGASLPVLFDVFFLGVPITLSICLAAHAYREQDVKFWRPAFALSAYCAFYLVGGREVLLYLLVGAMVGGGWVGAGGVAAPM